MKVNIFSNLGSIIIARLKRLQREASDNEDTTWLKTTLVVDYGVDVGDLVEESGQLWR